MRVWLRTALLIAGSLLAAFAYAADQPTVHVASPDSGGSCQIAPSTQASVLRNYTQAWRAMAAAFEQNNPALLDDDFVGVAREKLATTVQQQKNLNLRTYYRDQVHDVRFFFCSPAGMSVELVDSVDYELRIQDHDRTLVPQRVRVRYAAVLTPTETRWKVRMFQAEPQATQ